MKLSNRRMYKIMEDRETGCNTYDDKRVTRMIVKRIKYLSKKEDKEVWRENDVYFIEDADDKFGFKRYNPKKEKLINVVKQIEFLYKIIESF